VDWGPARVRRAAGVVLAAAVVGVGCCMVYLGGHWLTDVLAGWALGSVVGAAAAWGARAPARTSEANALIGASHGIDSDHG